MRRLVVPFVAVLPMAVGAVIHGALMMPERHALPRNDGRNALERHDERHYGDQQDSSELQHSGGDVTVTGTFDQPATAQFRRWTLASH